MYLRFVFLFWYSTNTFSYPYFTTYPHTTRMSSSFSFPFSPQTLFLPTTSLSILPSAFSPAMLLWHSHYSCSFYLYGILQHILLASLLPPQHLILSFPILTYLHAPCFSPPFASMAFPQFLPIWIYFIQKTCNFSCEIFHPSLTTITKTPLLIYCNSGGRSLHNYDHEQ